ncbi:hypothetical protein RI367_007316 [Sorochytrium milnesiophthora]
MSLAGDCKILHDWYNKMQQPTALSSWATPADDCCSWKGVGCLSTHRISSLSLSNMNLWGKLPPELGQLSSLTEMDLSTNDFTGIVPQSIWNLRWSSLKLNSNDFRGVIPLVSMEAWKCTMDNNPWQCQRASAWSVSDPPPFGDLRWVCYAGETVPVCQGNVAQEADVPDPTPPAKPTTTTTTTAAASATSDSSVTGPGVGSVFNNDPPPSATQTSSSWGWSSNSSSSSSGFDATPVVIVVVVLIVVVAAVVVRRRSRSNQARVIMLRQMHMQQQQQLQMSLAMSGGGMGFAQPPPPSSTLGSPAATYPYPSTTNSAVALTPPPTTMPLNNGAAAPLPSAPPPAYATNQGSLVLPSTPLASASPDAVILNTTPAGYISHSIARPQHFYLDADQQDQDKLVLPSKH